MNSPMKRHRTILADFIVGEPINETTLREALNEAEKDAEFIQTIKLMNGIGVDVITLCEQFEEHLAEFIDSSPQERDSEFPSLVQHYHDCSSCRYLFWEIKGMWSQEEHNVLPNLIQLRLSEPLRICLDENGALLPIKVTPFPMDYEDLEEVVAKAADEDEFKNQRKWEFTYPEFPGIIELKLIYKSDEFIQFDCALKYLDEKAAQNAKLMVQSPEKPYPNFDGDLQILKDNPLSLVPGDYGVQLAVEYPEGKWMFQWILLINKVGDHDG